MTPEFLEYEVRRLPDVVSAAVADSSVTVLVGPRADADAVQVVVAAMLAAAGLEASVQIMGGITSPAMRPRRLAPAAIGTVAGVGLLASVAAAAALTGTLPLSPDAVRPLTLPAPATVTAPTPVRRPSARVIVPGGQPGWAASQEPLPLPAALPAAVATPVEVAVVRSARAAKASRPAVLQTSPPAAVAEPASTPAEPAVVLVEPPVATAPVATPDSAVERKPTQPAPTLLLAVPAAVMIELPTVPSSTVPSSTKPATPKPARVDASERESGNDRCEGSSDDEGRRDGGTLGRAGAEGRSGHGRGGAEGRDKGHRGGGRR